MSYSVDTFLRGYEVPEIDDDFYDCIPSAYERHAADNIVEKFDLMALLVSPRENAVDTVIVPDKQLEPSQSKLKQKQIQARFSYVEDRYGTTSMQHRKTSKNTIERLANPILGHSSTLMALPEEIRKKRQLVEEQFTAKELEDERHEDRHYIPASISKSKRINDINILPNIAGIAPKSQIKKSMNKSNSKIEIHTTKKRQNNQPVHTGKKDRKHITQDTKKLQIKTIPNKSQACVVNFDNQNDRSQSCSTFLTQIVEDETPSNNQDQVISNDG